MTTFFGVILYVSRQLPPDYCYHGSPLAFSSRRVLSNTSFKRLLRDFCIARLLFMRLFCVEPAETW